MSAKILVIDIREAEDQNKAELLSRLKYERVEYLCFNENLAEKENGIIDFDSIYRESYDFAFDALIKYGSFKIDRDDTLAEVLKDNSNRSLWFYFRFMLLYQFRRIVFEFKIVEKIKTLKGFYQQIYVAHHSLELKEIFKKNEIDSVYYPKKRVKKSKVGLIIKFLCLTTIRFLWGIPKLLNLVNASQNHLFFSDAAHSQQVISMKNLKVMPGDHFTEYFQEYIEGKPDFLNISEFFPPKLSGNGYLNMSDNFWSTKYSGMGFMESLIYLQFFNPFFLLKAWRNFKRIQLGFRKIYSKKTNNYLDSRLLDLVQNYKSMCYLIGIRKAAFYYILKVFKFKSVISANEHNARAKSIMEVAEQLGIKTYGIQHGVIHAKHLHYIFSKEDATYKPFPDITFLWGEYWERTLLKYSNYELKNLKIVGQLRTDIIPQLKRISKKDLFQDLDSNKYTVLYPSQPLYTGEENMRKKLCIDFLKLTQSFPEVQFLVKPHPFEKDYKAFFNQHAEEVGATNFKFINDDLYKTLAYVDLVMIYNSTVGAEALYFRKPLIVMNYANNDFSGYIAEGIAKEVNNFQELKDGILAAINGDFLVDRSKIDRFIESRAFKVDGNSAKRIVDTLRAFRNG